MFVQRGQFGAARARYQRVDVTSRVEGANPHQLVAILYDELLQALDAMSVAATKKDYMQRGERQARAAAARLAQHSTGTLRRNLSYDAQGTSADRALAPAGTATEPGIWDDGQRTYLRYPGNRRPPMPYQVLANGTEAVVGQNTNPDPTTNGNILVLHGVFPMLRLRDGDLVLCVVNRAYDPQGANPGTNTISPDVIRVSREGGRG